MHDPHPFVQSFISSNCFILGTLGMRQEYTLILKRLASPELNVFYRECKRTQGVSTTDLVGRMLLMTKAHHSNIVSLPFFFISFQSVFFTAFAKAMIDLYCFFALLSGKFRLSATHGQLWKGECTTGLEGWELIHDILILPNSVCPAVT